MQHLNLVHFNGHIVDCNALYWNVCGKEYVCTVDSIPFRGGPIVCILDGRRKTQNSISIRIYAFRREYFTKYQYRWESIMLFKSNQRALNHHPLASIQMLVSFVVVPDVFLEPIRTELNRRWFFSFDAANIFKFNSHLKYSYARHRMNFECVSNVRIVKCIFNC